MMALLEILFDFKARRACAIAFNPTGYWKWQWQSLGWIFLSIRLRLLVSTLG